MRIGLVLAAAILALTGLAALFEAREAQAAPSICKPRYNLCLARCPGTNRCLARCKTRYRNCIAPYPSMADLL
jgi:hypothetical protein